jgi:hypothetical protein
MARAVQRRSGGLTIGTVLVAKCSYLEADMQVRMTSDWTLTDPQAAVRAVQLRTCGLESVGTSGERFGHAEVVT